MEAQDLKVIYGLKDTLSYAGLQDLATRKQFIDSFKMMIWKNSLKKNIVQ